jgi:hypothetical protein
LSDIVLDLEAELMKIAVGEHAAEIVSPVARLLNHRVALTRSQLSVRNGNSCSTKKPRREAGAKALLLGKVVDQ